MTLQRRNLSRIPTGDLERRFFGDSWPLLGSWIDALRGATPTISASDPFAHWTPPKVDISERDDELEVNVELPGMRRDEVAVTLRDNHLIIVGEKKAETEDTNRTWYRRERSFGAFRRVLALPTEIDPQDVNAQFADGVLTVTLPKSATSKAVEKQIPISAPESS